MQSIKTMVARLFGQERRQHQEPIAEDRRKRKKATMKDADARLNESLEDFSRTVMRHRDRIIKRSANDVQEVVIFSTFQGICTARGPAIMGKRLCRHPARNGLLAECNERSCPIFLKAAVA